MQKFRPEVPQTSYMDHFPRNSAGRAEFRSIRAEFYARYRIPHARAPELRISARALRIWVQFGTYPSGIPHFDGILHFHVQFRTFSIAKRRQRCKKSQYIDGFSMLCKFQLTLLHIGHFLRKNSHFSILVLRNAGSRGSRKLGPD